MGRRAYIFAVLVAIASNDGNEPVSELLASDHRASIDVDLNTAFVVVAIDIVVVANVIHVDTSALGGVGATRSSRTGNRSIAIDRWVSTKIVRTLTLKMDFIVVICSRRMLRVATGRVWGIIWFS